MRPAILSLAILLVACGDKAPDPEPVEPEPVPVAEPEPEREPLPVVEPEMTDCVDLTFDEGAEGSYALPAEGEEGHDTHVKHHFEMPEGKDALVLDLTADEAWTFEVAAGVGACPHHGVTHGTVEGSGAIHLYVPANKLGDDVEAFPAGEKWYVHLDHKSEHEAGTEAKFTMAGKVCTAVVPEAAAGRPQIENRPKVLEKVGNAPGPKGGGKPAAKTGGKASGGSKTVHKDATKGK